MAEAWEPGSEVWEALDIGLTGLRGAGGQGGGAPWLEKCMRSWQIPGKWAGGFGRCMADVRWVWEKNDTGPHKHQSEGTILMWHTVVISEAYNTLFLSLVASAASPGHEAPQRQPHLTPTQTHPCFSTCGTHSA